MKVECLVENISPLLTILSKALPTHTQIPVLSNILLKAEGNTFSLSATDLEFGIKINVPAKIEEEGAITVPGKQLIEVLHSLPKDKVRFDVEQGTFFLYSRENRIAFQTISADEFPPFAKDLGEKKSEFELEQFHSIFSGLAFSVSADSARAQLTGIYIVPNSGGVDFVATDGYRLSVKSVLEKNMELEKGIIITARLINEVLAFRNTKQAVAMYISPRGDQAFFEAEDILMAGRLIDGDFPNYQKVIPQTHTSSLVADREEFLQAVRLVGVFARDNANIIRLSLKEGVLYFHAKSQGVGEGEIKIDVEQEGDDNEIAFNVKYLVDFLKNTEGKKISLELNSALQPGLFRIVGDSSYLHVIMPVRTQDA